ncbi:MAG: L,D-transpeptidase family protein, partial [Firmicutes bacterium]|nr:L,D-transpeptidase family protein [Bacillota bacterium]
MKKAVLLIIIIISFLLSPSISWAEENFSPVEGTNTVYKVKSSDSLYSIARKFDVSMEHIALANGMTSYYVRAGQKLVIPLERVFPGTLENGIILNLPEREIYFFKNGKLKAIFPCAVGAPGRWMTPRGDFYIASRIMNPIWLPPEWAGIEHPVLPGPSNPLGDRWMGLSQPGVGMHATNAPASIGEAVSHGCIRMYPEDAHALFKMVTVGLPVKIIYEPVKVGFSMKTKKFYLSVFPDIYYFGTNNFKEVMKKLKSLEINKFVKEKQIKRIISEARGISYQTVI